MRRMTLVLALTVAVTGCGSPEDVSPTTAEVPTATATQPVEIAAVAGDVTASSGCVTPTNSASGAVQLLVEGVERTYSIYMPQDVSGPMPVVLSYHGFTQSRIIQTELSRLNEFVEEAGIVAVFPQGMTPPEGGPAYFNIDTTDESSLVDDVAFTEAILDSLEADFCVDRSRIYAMGFSNGGSFVSVLACRLGDRIAAVAPVAGVFMPDDCGARSVPMLATHGTNDGLVPFEELDPVYVRDVVAQLGGTEAQVEMFAAFDRPASTYVELWADHNGCGAAPTSSELGENVVLLEYPGCSAGGDVGFQVVDGGDHAWPGPTGGSATTEIDATSQALAFFEAHTLPLEYLNQ